MAELSAGDLGDKVGREAREAAAKKGGEVVRGEAVDEVVGQVVGDAVGEVMGRLVDGQI